MTAGQWVVVGFAVAFFVFGAYLLLKQLAAADAASGKVSLFSMRAEGPVGLLLIVMSAILLIVAFTAMAQTSGANGSSKASGSPPTSRSASTPHSTSVTSSPPSTSTSRVLTPSSHLPPRPQIVIKSPKEGQGISGSAGVLVAGTAVGLGRSDLWLFDTQLTDPTLYRANEQPIEVTSDGKWAYQDQPIGDLGSVDVGQRYILVVVVASPSCSETVKTKAPNSEGDVVFSSLPSGCSEVGRRSVVKTRP